MSSQVIFAESDARRLRTLLGNPPRSVEAASLDRLRRELESASVVPDHEVPDDVVTVNSVVELEDLSDGEIDTYTLVLPAEANASEGRISLLAPLGMGMLGYRTGDEVEWPVPGGTARFRIRKVTGNSARPAGAAVAAEGVRH